MEVGERLIDQVLQTIREHQPIPSKRLKMLFGHDPNLPEAISKLVKEDLIVLDDLNQFNWKIKRKVK